MATAWSPIRGASFVLGMDGAPGLGFADIDLARIAEVREPGARAVASPAHSAGRDPLTATLTR